MITWVVGSGGLLGSALAHQCADLYLPGPVPWSAPQQAAEVLHAQARAFEAAASDGPWRVIWAAGAASTATARDEAMQELIALEGLLSGIRSAQPHGAGAFFLTSSAGGVYAGSPDPAPFTTTSTPHPLSPYGELKLAQEAMAADLLGHTLPVIVGRVSNLYSPGQNLQKLQGLVSRLAALTQQPIEIFVPLGTIRDYVFTSDAARTILDLTSEPDRLSGVTTHIIATGRGTTIGQLVRTTREVVKRHLPVSMGTHHSARAQAEDLRVIPSCTLSRETPLAAGIKAVYLDLLARTQTHSLAGAASL